MIETCHPFNGVKRLRGMAIDASLSEFTLMWFSMTTCAILMFFTGKLLKVNTIPGSFRMTINTNHGLMFASEGEFCVVVIKPGSGLE
jgi:hypothetical protein